MEGYGFRVFKIGEVMALVGFVAWLCTILTGHIFAAIAASAFGTIGAIVLLFGVLEGRRREIHDQRS